MSATETPTTPSAVPSGRLPGPSTQPPANKDFHPRVRGVAEHSRAGARQRAMERAQRWRSTILFLVAFGVFAYVGVTVVVEQNVVVFDSLSRLAHAYFAIHNDPPKLAAIGFEWPPIMTLVFLPLAAIKPLGSSFAALPLTSAIFGAALLVITDRTFAMLGMRWFLRLPLLFLLALNPMYLFYATNGMAEMVYLFFLAVGLHFFVRWHLDRRAHHLCFSGLAMTLGMLSRYEVGAYALCVGIGVFMLLVWRRASRSEIDGSLTLYGAPIVYGLGAWLFFNWLIVGNPLYWLERQAEKNVTVGRGVAGKEDLASIPLGDIASDIIELNARLFPLTLIIVVALIVWAVVRRDPMALILAGLGTLNAVMTAVFIYTSHDPSLLQLRYNMRALPVILIAVGWLFYSFRSRIGKGVVWGLAAVTMAISIPLAWQTMKTYPYQFEEQAFVRALETGDDQEGTRSIGDFKIGIRHQRDMADYINGLGLSASQVFTDDESSTFGVMLAGGQPDKFFDRIDQGDKLWEETLADPYGDVEYILISKFLTDIDHVRYCYPELLEKGGLPGIDLVYENGQFALFSVQEYAPIGGTGKETFTADCPLAS